MTDVVIASAARAAIGSSGRGPASVPPSDLGAIAASAAPERAENKPGKVDHVVLRNVIHTEPADAYTARLVGMKAGLPTGAESMSRGPDWMPGARIGEAELFDPVMGAR